MIDDDDALERRLAADPTYRLLVQERGRFAGCLTGVTLSTYAAFISLIAFDKPFLARPIGGSHVTLAIAFGFAMIVGAIGVCAVYVARANRIDDVRIALLMAEVEG